TVVLAAVLLGAGTGSLLAARINLLQVVRWGLLLPTSVLLVNLLLQPIFETTLGWPYAARVLASVALLAPTGVLMGFALPAGMAIFPAHNMPWYWPMIGVASVLATVFSLILAMVIGLTGTAWFGAALYGAGWLMMWMHTRSAKRPLRIPAGVEA